MSESNTAVVETPTATETAPKSNGKPKAVKTAAKKPTAKPVATNGKSTGLRKAQLRVLTALKKAAKPLTRAQISEKGQVDVASMVEYIGSHDEAVRKANDKKHFPSLLTLKLVKFGPSEDGVTYEITAAGKVAVDKASK